MDGRKLDDGDTVRVKITQGEEVFDVVDVTVNGNAIDVSRQKEE